MKNQKYRITKKRELQERRENGREQGGKSQTRKILKVKKFLIRTKKLLKLQFEKKESFSRNLS